MAAPSFSKKEEEILKLELRRRVYELVSNFSGCNFHELKRKSNIPPGTLKYHLNYMTRHGVITSERDGNRIRYFTKEITRKNKRVLSILRQKGMRDILLIILNNRECRQRDIIRSLNLSASTVHAHLRRLVNEDILAMARKGNKVHYRLAVNEEEVIRLLITYRESFFDNLVEKTIEMWKF